MKDASGNKETWLGGAALLGAAALLSKLLGTLQKIPLQNLGGDRVFGLYNAVYPFYQLLLFMAAAGIPIAVSIIVAERRQAADYAGMRQVLQVGLWLLGLTGVVGFLLLWAGADLAALLLGDADTAAAVRAGAIGLLFVPMMGALRGYYQGQQNMRPSALSQVTEQSIRVTVLLVLLFVGLSQGWSESGLAAGAMVGSAVGGAAGLLVISVYWLRRRGREPALLAAKVKMNGSGRKAVGRLVKLAIPVTLGSLAVPVAGVVDALTVPRLLLHSGAGQEEVMSLFGLYSRGQPLVQLVVMVAGAAGAALVPAMAAAQASRVQQRQRAGLALRLAWWLGAASSIGLVMLAEPINRMLYADNAHSLTFALIGSTALAGTLSAVTAALLQGLGAVRLPALLLLAAALLKAALNAALVPAYGIAGAALAGIAAFYAAALLGVAAAWRAAGTGRPAMRVAAGTCMALASMAAALWLAERGAATLLEPLALPSRAAAALWALAGIAVGGAVFAAALLRFGVIRASELRGLPGGSRLTDRLIRWRLLAQGSGNELNK